MVVQNNKGGTICTTYYGGTIKYSGADNETKMNKDKHIPTGYKPSPLGNIPKEWEVKRLGECTNLLTNGFVGVATPHYTEDSDGITYIQGYNVAEGGFNLRGIKKVTKEFHKKNSKSSLLEGDLLTIQTGDIGLTTIVPKDLEGSNCHALIISRFNNSIIPRFMLYYYNSSIGRERFRKIETGTTMKHINTGDLINFLVPVPSIEEQKAIVDLLKLWDTAIAKQTALIENLSLRKRGLMQQLLTGKKRLEEFCGEWKEVRLGEIGVFFKGGGVPKDKITNSGNKCLTYGDLYTKYDFVISDVKSYIDDHTANESVKIRYGDICFAGSGETKEDIGKCAAFIDNKYGYAGGDIIVFRANDCNPITLSYILNSSDVIRQKSNMGQGHSVVHIYPYQLEKLLIKLPSRAEQDAIATILMESDKEIEIQKQKLAAMQAQKKGLMQVLLSGKRRVK